MYSPGQERASPFADRIPAEGCEPSLAAGGWNGCVDQLLSLTLAPPTGRLPLVTRHSQPSVRFRAAHDRSRLR